jgi:hypothetical protein
VRLQVPEGALDLLVLSCEDAERAWVLEAQECPRRLLLSHEELAWGRHGDVEVVSGDPSPDAAEYDPGSRSFRPLRLRPAGPPPAGTVPVATTLLRPPAPAVPATYGTFGGRQSAPSRETFDRLAAVHELHLPPWTTDPDQDALLRVRWTGDVAELRVDGRTVADRFWDGSSWIVNLTDAGVASGSRVTQHLLPHAADSAVHLPADAAARREATSDQLLTLDDVSVEGRRTWHELRPADDIAAHESAA